MIRPLLTRRPRRSSVLTAVAVAVLASPLAATPAHADGGYAPSCGVVDLTSYKSVDMFVIASTTPLYYGQSCEIGKTSLRMQPDGNLVVLDENGRARWASGTHVASGEWSMMRMQPDGNLVVSGPSGPMWATGTNVVHPKTRLSSENEANYHLAVQADGNVVIYDGYPDPHQSNLPVIWATNTDH